MKEKTRKLIQWIGLILAVIGGAFAIAYSFGADKDHVMEGMHEVGNSLSGLYDIAYVIVVAMIMVAVAAMIIFLVRNLINNKRMARRWILGLGLLVITFVVAYFVSPADNISQVMLEKNNLSVGTSKAIGAAIITVYVLAIAAVCAIVFTSMAKSFKKK
ncbi:MAG: hypothetical protein SPJ13_02130 [Bacteroidales bacterium]|nr:hypothetical protein [Bacteroidales bacterium]